MHNLPPKLVGEINYFIRQANSPRCERLVQELSAILAPRTDPETGVTEFITAADAMVAFSTVLASVVMQGDPRVRRMVARVTGGMVSLNIDRMQIAEAADRAAKEATAAAHGTANGLPI